MKRKRLKKLLMATGETRDNAEIVSMLWRGKARESLAATMKEQITKRKAAGQE